MIIRKPDSWGYLIIWEFRARPRMKKRFEAAYGPQGEWARFFGQDKQYVGTELIRDLKRSRTYLTLDFWTSPKAYEKFRKRHAEEYKAINARCETLTESEREIGRYVKAGQSGMSSRAD